MFIWFRNGTVEPYIPTVRHDTIHRVNPMHPGIPDKSVSINEHDERKQYVVQKFTQKAAEAYEQEEFSPDESHPPVFARDIMSRNVVTIEQDSLIDDVESKFESKKFRHIPVVNSKGDLTGMISEIDIFKHLLNSYKRNMHLTPNIKILEIMMTEVLTGFPDTAIREIAKIMFEHKIGSVPIVNREDHKLIGIITRSDILKSVMRHTSMNLYG